MNVKRLYTERKYIKVVVGILLFVVFLQLLLLSYQIFSVISYEEVLSSEDKSEINQEVKKVLSDTPLEDKLKFTNYRKERDWSAVVVYSDNDLIDPNFVILQRKSGEWKVVYGPATDSDPEYLKSIGAPQNFIAKVDKIFIPQ